MQVRFYLFSIVRVFSWIGQRYHRSESYLRIVRNKGETLARRFG
jgi:hypothetical protein